MWNWHVIAVPHPIFLKQLEVKMELKPYQIRINDELKTRLCDVAHRTQAATWRGKANVSGVLREALKLGLDELEQRYEAQPTME